MPALELCAVTALRAAAVSLPWLLCTALGACSDAHVTNPSPAATGAPAAATATATTAVPQPRAAAQAAAPTPAPQDPKLDLNAVRENAFGAENQGRHGEAADAFLVLCKAEPARAEWVVAAGRCLGRSGRFREAITLLDTARTQFPAVLDVTAMLARTFLLQAENERGMLHPEIAWADAAGLAEEVLQSEPNHEDSRMVLAQARYLLGDHDEAVRQAEEAARRHPQHPGAHVLLGRIAMDRFRSLLQRHERERPDGQAAADLVAAIDVQRRAARAAYLRAIELDSSRPLPHVALANLAQLDRRDEQARQHLADALVADPEVAIDHGAVERGLDPKGRIELWTEVLRRYEATPQHRARKAATLRWFLGRAHYDGASWESAQRLFTQALADDPGATNGLYYLAFAAYQAGDHDAAERHAANYAALGAPAFADVVRKLDGELRGQNGAILQFLADRAFQQGRIAPSRDLNHVIACLKDSADAWNNHAFLCRETGRFEDALASYQHAVEREPDSPHLWNDLAVVLQYHLPTPENLARARNHYERALQLAAAVLADGKAPAAKRELAQKAQQDATANLKALK